MSHAARGRAFSQPSRIDAGWKASPKAPGPAWQPRTAPTSTMVGGSPVIRATWAATASACSRLAAWPPRPSSVPTEGPRLQLLDQAVQRPLVGAYPVDRVDLAIHEAEDGLDVQDGAEEGSGAADAPASVEVLEGLHGEDELLRGDQAVQGGDDVVGVAAPVPDGDGRLHRVGVAGADRPGVDHPDVEVGEGLARLQRRADRPAQVAGDGGADDAAALRPEPGEDLGEVTRRGCDVRGWGPPARMRS